MRHVNMLLDKLKNVSKTGKGYLACCPAHDDSNPSLQVTINGQSEISLRCQSAKCKTSAILSSLDLSPDDLSPDPDEEIIVHEDHSRVDLPAGHGLVRGSVRTDADVELRSNFYTAFLQQLVLTDDHREDLHRRGLDDQEIDERGYRSLTYAERGDALAAIRTTFDDASLLSVPGIVRGDNGDLRMTGPGQGLVIPSRDELGRMVALKVRRDEGHEAHGKYACISGGGGPSCGTPTHVPRGIQSPAEIVRLTEGELKADVATVLSGLPTIGIPGVSNWHSALPVLQALHVQSVQLAFDADCMTKTHVAKHLIECATACREAGYVVSIERWNPDDGKGIDDLLAAGKQPDLLTGQDAIEFLNSILNTEDPPIQPDVIVEEDPPPNEVRPAENSLATMETVLPFPLHIFPVSLQEFIRQVARSVDCPIDLVGVPMLAVAATAIGASRSVIAKGGWSESARIYVATVAPPGSGKSPAETLVTRPIYKLQNKLKSQRSNGATAHEADEVRVLGTDANSEDRIQPDPNEKASSVLSDADEQGIDTQGADAANAQEPAPRRVVVGDITTESLALVLAENPRGIIMIRDEIPSWVRGMNQYKGGKGTDRQFFLSCWSGQPALVDRKSLKQPINIPRPFINISGGIQPDMLPALVDEKGRSDGFLDRILFSFPDPITPAGWTEQGVDTDTEQLWENLLGRLFRLEMDHNDEEGVLEPRALSFTEGAKAAWAPWYNDHLAETMSPELPEALRGPWAKLKSYCLRFSLTMQLIWSADQEVEADFVDEVSLERAIKLIEYFKSHAHKVYASLVRDAEDRRVGEAVAWIDRHGGRCTARELTRSKVGRIKKTSEAVAMLKDLVDRCLGSLEDQPNAQGKLVTYFVLR